jgi:D-threonate/D-erythronate kinase
VEGELRVDGVALEQTDVWKREDREVPSKLAGIVAGFGMRTVELDLATVRSGAAALKGAMASAAHSAEVVICDAETDADLAAITSASMGLARRAVWVGSAGLARQLQRTGERRVPTGALDPSADIAKGPVLFVVGSASRVAREQTERLAALPEMVTVCVPVRVLQAGPRAAEWAEQEERMMRALGAGQDVLVMADGEALLTYRHGADLAGAIGRFVTGAADRVSGLVATGGETARAVLDAWQVRGLRVLGEVDTGVPFSVAEGWVRRLPVVTKAGGFGDPETLVRCREFLRGMMRSATTRAGAGR